MDKNSLNSVQLIGRIGQDPEIKYTQSQTAVTNISIATTSSHKDASGNYVDTTEWHNVVVWSKQAEFVANFLKKGALVYISGRLATRSWEDKDGIKKYKTEVVAQVVTSLGSAPKRDDAGTYPESPRNEPPANPAANPFGGDDDSEPLPF